MGASEIAKLSQVDLQDLGFRAMQSQSVGGESFGKPIHELEKARGEPIGCAGADCGTRQRHKPRKDNRAHYAWIGITGD